MPIPQQLPVTIYEQEVPPICHLLFSLFCGTRHKDTLLAPSCVCEYWQSETSDEQNAHLLLGYQQNNYYCDTLLLSMPFN